MSTDRLNEFRNHAHKTFYSQNRLKLVLNYTFRDSLDLRECTLILNIEIISTIMYKFIIRHTGIASAYIPRGESKLDFGLRG